MGAPADNLLALAFADQCRRWTRQFGASAAAIQAVSRAAQALVEAESAGHVCLALDDGPRPWTEADLLASGVVGEPDSACPLVLDGPRLYLARHYAAEARLARSLVQRHRNVPPQPGPAARALLHQLFSQVNGGDGQMMAVALALSRRLAVISGGPGTGKTTTVTRLLACLLADAPDARVALAAPTGKAAARLQESLEARAGELPAELAALLPRQAYTLHRLLGLGPDGDSPRHHADNPLPLDVLVVDEASMMDLGLALQLCAALPASTRLILLGDRYQLQAVEAGAVFAVLSGCTQLTPATRQELAELCGWPESALPSKPDGSAPLNDLAVELIHSHRFAGDAPLGRVATALVQGLGAEALAGFSGTGMVHLSPTGSGLGTEGLQVLLEGYEPYRQALAAWQAQVPDPAPLFAALAQFRVLCVTRRGERGVEGVNEALTACLRPHGYSVQANGLFHGQALMIRRNDPVSRLYNGDVGLVLEGGEAPGGLSVWFPDGQGGYRQVAPGRLPAWETAWAMTVHKSQGSEFESVALVLPDRDMPLLTRELVYTAITRARSQVSLLGEGNLLLQAAARSVRREGGLEARLGET